MLKRKKRKKRNAAKPALELLDEAFTLVRKAPLSLSAAYLAGTVPFALGVVYFWSDMSRSAFADERCLEFSLILTAFFFWMKAMHAVYARGLRAIASGRTYKWTLRKFTRMTASQLCLQPYGIFLIPVSMLLAFPLPAIYAFYQNLSILEERSDESLVAYAKRAWQQGRLWPAQSGIIIWLLSPWLLGAGLLISFGIAGLFTSMLLPISQFNDIVWFLISIVLVYGTISPFTPFGCIIAANVAVTIYFLPALLRMLLGIDTIYSLSGYHAVCNTTFVVTVFVISYIFLDPLIKASYALRCYYGDSIRSGEDILKDLKYLKNK